MTSFGDLFGRWQNVSATSREIGARMKKAVAVSHPFPMEAEKHCGCPRNNSRAKILLVHC